MELLVELIIESKPDLLVSQCVVLASESCIKFHPSFVWDTVLGPLMFLLYINGITNKKESIHHSIFLLRIACFINGVEDTNRLQEDLNRLS